MVFYKDIIIRSLFFPLLLSLGAFTKSAQIPFSAWLPAAIAAPTPVSSLVHSSTLVTAGVYLLFRNLRDLLFNRVQNLIMFLGIRTILIASVAATNEKDIKKIVALSTLSQLGLIITRLGCKWVFIRFLMDFYGPSSILVLRELTFFEQKYRHESMGCLWQIKKKRHESTVFLRE